MLYTPGTQEMEPLTLMDAKAICKALIESGGLAAPLLQALLTPWQPTGLGLNEATLRVEASAEVKGPLCGQNCFVMGQWEQRLAIQGPWSTRPPPSGGTRPGPDLHSALGASSGGRRRN